MALRGCQWAISSFTRDKSNLKCSTVLPNFIQRFELSETALLNFSIRMAVVMPNELSYISRMNPGLYLFPL